MTTPLKNNDLITSFDDVQFPGQRRNAVQSMRTGANEQPFTPSQYWVNVGVRRTAPDGTSKLVALPMGIPLDKGGKLLAARRIPGPDTKNPEFRFLRIAEADLWAKVQKLMATLKPGETISLPFEVEIRRVAENEVTEEELSSAENPFAVGDLGI